MIDVHKDQRIYLKDPEPQIPASKGSRGRRPNRYKSTENARKVETIAQQTPDSAWHKITLRDGEKGALIVEVIHHRVWFWDGKREEGQHWHLLIRREVGSPNEIKYSLSNAEAGTGIEQLAHMQDQRFWIERSFQDGKSHCGLGDYQVRSWQGVASSYGIGDDSDAFYAQRTPAE